MKRFISVLLVCVVLMLSGCGNNAANTISGEVVTCGGNPYFFEVSCKNGKNYGFLISESTELIWEDNSAWSIWREDTDPWDVFSCSMYVTVEPGAAAESADDYVDECVEGWFYADKVTVTGVNENYFAVDEKPVIYLYPETTTEIAVKLEYNGRLTCTYPEYKNGWSVTAEPDGTLTDSSGLEYNYLYWEGATQAKYDFSEGFCVAGKDTAEFLETALEQLGLTRAEANEFIIYWLPRMQANAFNLISFQTDAYTDNAVLNISPDPDTVIRVFMAWKALEQPVDIVPQDLVSTERVGFTVVEWGGACVD